MSAELAAVWPSDAPRKALTWQTTNAWRYALQRFDSYAYTRLQFLRAVSHAVDSEKMLSESFRGRRLWRHRGPEWQYTASEWWRHQWRHQRPYQLTQLLTSARCVSSHGTAWYTHRAGAVRSSTLLWVVCQRSAQPRTRLSSLPHAYQHVAASVHCTNLTYAWTWVWK